jgi:ribose-phosphate pyrophosphokinase
MITFKAKEANGEIINSAYHEFTFPAGEKHIKKTEDRPTQPVEIAIFQPSPDSIHNDLFTLAMWADMLVPEHPETKSVLVMPYVPGARADRGLPFGLEIYAGFINELEIDQIIIFDPHSQVAPEKLRGYENLTVVYSYELFELGHMKAVINQYDAIIAPDKGAATRAKQVADVAGIPVITATKERDEATGQLSNFQIEGLDSDGTYLIVDDICDRGGTFKGLAKASGLPPENIDLYVSHGVFSSDALETLPEYFEYIYTTNSYNPQRELSSELYPQIRRFDVIRLMLSKIKY